MSAGDRTVHRAVVAGEIGNFAGEEQRVLDRSSELLLSRVATQLDVAVGSTGQRIALPIVPVDRLQQALNLTFADIQKAGEGLHGLFGDEIFGAP